MTNVAPREDKIVQPPLGGEPAGSAIGRAQWLALLAAFLGWMFDGFEMGIFSLVGRPALQNLLPHAHTYATPQALEQDVALWFGIILAGFLVGAATGGVLFGWLGDRIGRVRAMTLSVLTYTIFTGLSGLSTQAWHIGALRFLAALGMGGEWSLGVALVMEVWPNRSRAFMAGLIGAAANVGYLLVAVVGIGLNVILADLGQALSALSLPQDMIDPLMAFQGWRIMMLLGAAPAILTFMIRLFVPESKRWQHEQDRGATLHWQSQDLLGVLIGGAGPILIIYLFAFPATGSIEHTWPVRIAGAVAGLAIATAGYLYPVRRYIQRQAIATRVPAAGGAIRLMLLGAGLSGVALLGTWGSAQWAAAWAGKLTEKLAVAPLHPKEYTQICGAVGAILGTIGAALLCDRLGRRITYSLLCIVSMASLLLLYQGNTHYGGGFLVSCFIMGVCTASFYGWLPLYLPELFQTSIRATGQGFSFNFGRVIAAVGTLQTANLFAEHITVFGRTYDGGYPFACSAMSLIYLLGLVLIWFGPETKGKPLPD